MNKHIVCRRWPANRGSFGPAVLCVMGLLVAALAVDQPLAARDVYISNAAGDDLADGLAPRHQGPGNGPVRTIARGLRIADQGDRVILEKTDQPYREAISLSSGRHCGSEHRPFTIVGNGAILDGTAEVPPAAWEHVRGNLYRFQPRRLTSHLLYLGPKPASRGLWDPTADEPAPKPLEWAGLASEIHFAVEPGKLPEEYPLRYTALQTGITLYHVRHVRITDLVVQGFRLDGINAHDGVNDCELEGLTCRGNARSGISVGGASRVRIDNCLVGDNGSAQLRCEGYSIARVDDTVVVANTAPAFEIVGGRLLVDGQPHESLVPSP